MICRGREFKISIRESDRGHFFGAGWHVFFQATGKIARKCSSLPGSSRFPSLRPAPGDRRVRIRGHQPEVEVILGAHEGRNLLEGVETRDFRAGFRSGRRTQGENEPDLAIHRGLTEVNEPRSRAVTTCGRGYRGKSGHGLFPH